MGLDLLKEFLKEEGLSWIQKEQFVKNEDGTSVTIRDKDHFLSVIRRERLPYCIDGVSLDKIVSIGPKTKYQYVWYLYATVTDKKIDQLGCLCHKSNLKYILRKHSDEPIMDKGEVKIRQSFDSLLNFIVKLGYLTGGKDILGDEELAFFSSYVKKVYSVEAVKEYIQTYEFRLD